LNQPAVEYGCYLIDETLTTTGLKAQGWRYKIVWLPHSITGACEYTSRTIFVSTNNIPDEGFVPYLTDVTAHELSHALCGPEQGHGEMWRSTCIELGGSGDRLALPTERDLMSLQKNINQHYVDAISSLSHCEYVEASKLQQRWQSQEIDASVCAACGEPSSSQVLYREHPMMGGDHVAQNLLPSCWKCSGQGLN
jgi:hypothetical protein